VTALLDIRNAAFAHQCGLGIWWAMYGDEQGKGPYPDSYLIENIERNIRCGRFDSPSSEWFSSLGFYLGMIHGGMLDPRSCQLRQLESLVILTDLDFTNDYHYGQPDQRG